MGRTNHVIADAARQRLRCERCGREVPIPLGNVEWVIAYLRTFARAHRWCGKIPDASRAFTSTPGGGHE